MNWNNSPLILFHGTDLPSAQAILTQGIRLSFCRPGTDFGRGFYGTTLLHQAKNWANRRCLTLQAAGVPNAIAAVMRFSVSRNALANLEALSFVTDGPQVSTSDFWKFVWHCRMQIGPHRPRYRRRDYDVETTT